MVLGTTVYPTSSVAQGGAPLAAATRPLFDTEKSNSISSSGEVAAVCSQASTTVAMAGEMPTIYSIAAISFDVACA
jgi:hypothetical protein